jgi:hypothetical protein
MDPLAGIVCGAGAAAKGCLVATRPCFAILGIMGFLGAGLPEIASVRSRNSSPGAGAAGMLGRLDGPPLPSRLDRPGTA